MLLALVFGFYINKDNSECFIGHRFQQFILDISPPGLPSPRYRSGGTLLERPVSSGKQDYQTDSSLYPLNQPVEKLEAQIQASGEARYVNDIPPMRGEVFGAFVLSTVHSGDVDEIDASEVLVRHQDSLRLLYVQRVRTQRSYTLNDLI